MSAEADRIELERDEWDDLLAAAATLDLVHGGYFRARGSTIQFYCCPENAPEGWSDGFPDGSPDLPRALVGEAQATVEPEARRVSVRLLVSNWSAVRAVKQRYDRGEYRGRFERFIQDQESALRGREEDRAWLREQFRRLRGHAAGRILEEDRGG